MIKTIIEDSIKQVEDTYTNMSDLDSLDRVNLVIILNSKIKEQFQKDIFFVDDEFNIQTIQTIKTNADLEKYISGKVYG